MEGPGMNVRPDVQGRDEWPRQLIGPYRRHRHRCWAAGLRGSNEGGVPAPDTGAAIASATAVDVETRSNHDTSRFASWGMGASIPM